MPSTSSSPDEPNRRLRALVLGVAAALVVLVAAVTFVVAADHDGGVNADPPGSDCAPVAAADAGSPQAGDVAPGFRLPTLDGGCFDLADARGDAVVVNFWASWCTPCRDEFPLLADAYDERRDDGLRVVGVTYRDIASDSRRFAEDEDADWTLVTDEDGVVAREYGVRPIPQTIFVRRDGTISARINGELTRRELNAEIQRILAR